MRSLHIGVSHLNNVIVGCYSVVAVFSFLNHSNVFGFCTVGCTKDVFSKRLRFDFFFPFTFHIINKVIHQKSPSNLQ